MCRVWVVKICRFLSIPLAVCCHVALVHAQDMEPRAFSSAPIGTNFLGVGHAYSDGEVSLDPSLPITDVQAKIHVETFGYSRFFALAGRTASASMLLPTYNADLSGNVGEERRKINRTGIGDMRFRLAANLLGAPAMTPEEFAHRSPATALGLSLAVSAPTGEYDSRKLINIGANRWAFKPEIGITQPIGNWFIEGSGGAWFFSHNDNFFGGRERTQDPIGSIQVHAGYNFRPGFWLAADGCYWEGGRTAINGVDGNDRQESSRYGLTLSVPLSKDFSLKLAWSNGLMTRVGGDFDTVLAALQYRWSDK